MSDDSNVTHLPEPGVILDLDLVEREAKDIKPPFITKIGDKRITWADPTEIDWKRLAGVATPADLLHVALSKDDARFLLGLELPTWKFGKLMETYNDYYELDEKIQAAKHRQRF